MYFSISHSQNIVMAAFDDFPCGIDLEKIKNINLKNFSKRYNKNFKTLVDFYKFWTEYEAEIKLQCSPKSKYSMLFENEFAAACVSAKENLQKPVIKNILK